MEGAAQGTTAVKATADRWATLHPLLGRTGCKAGITQYLPGIPGLDEM